MFVENGMLSSSHFPQPKRFFWPETTTVRDLIPLVFESDMIFAIHTNKSELSNIYI